ncbi:hypothetical protein N9M66_01385 [Litoreibacter sp.]|nr:hypothetical protein [Litoreibacter sp.]
MNPNQKYVRWAVLRQLPLAGFVAASLIGATLLAVQIMPVNYVATARLLVEATAVSNNTGAGTDTMTGSAHLQNIENRVLTLTRLTEIQGNLNINMTAEDLRDATIFETISGRDKATVMNISVTSADPDLSTTLTNQLAEEVLKEHRIIRTERAEEALIFFRQEVADSKSRLDAKFAALFAFKRSRAGRLPQDTARYHAQRETLFSQLSTGPKVVVKSTAHRRLIADLTAARAIYAEQHPLVQSLAAKLAQIAPTQAVIQTNSPELADELNRIDIALSEIPANELQLDTLQRDYDMAESQYTSATNRLEAAAIEERIALRAKGDRLSIVERAVLPDAPAGPRQKIVLAVGILAAMLLAIGTAILRARSDQHIRRPKDLETALDLMPYAVIPRMKPS